MRLQTSPPGQARCSEPAPVESLRALRGILTGVATGSLLWALALAVLLRH